MLGSPAVAEICARGGFDWVLVDLEHGMIGDDHLAPMLMAIAGQGAAAIVRVENGTRLRVGRALDLGAEGVMVPQVHSVRRPRRSPDGCASSRPVGAAWPSSRAAWPTARRATMRRPRATMASWASCRSSRPPPSRRPRASPRSRASTSSSWGRPTSSHALGVPGRLDAPVYEDAIRRVASAARGAGKAAGVLVWSPTDVPRYVALGYTFFAISSDGSILDRAMKAALADARAATGGRET